MNILPTLIACTTLILPSHALTIFSSMESGPDAWSWGDARVKAHAQGLLIKEHNRSGDYGDAYLSDPLPYLANATVNVSVKPVLGAVTIQLICFQGNAALATIDLLKDVKSETTLTTPLHTQNIPTGTERITFKVWTTGAESASTILEELTYSTDSESTNLDLSEISVESKNELSSKLTPEGLVLSAPSGSGSVIMNARLPKNSAGSVLLKLSDVRESRVSLQVLYFATDGTYLGDANLLSDVGDGWYKRNLDASSFAPNTARVDFKLWVNGQNTARVTVNSFTVLP